MLAAVRGAADAKLLDVRLNAGGVPAGEANRPNCAQGSPPAVLNGEGRAMSGLLPMGPTLKPGGILPDPGALGLKRFAFALRILGEVAGDACALFGDPPTLPADSNALALEPDPTPEKNRSAVSCAKGLFSAALANVGVPGAECVGVALGLG